MDSTADLQRVKDWLNVYYADAAIQTEYLESSSTSAALSANASSVALPAAVIVLEYIVPISGGQTWMPMEEVDFEHLLELRSTQSGASSNQGAPTKYTIRNATVEFWPNAVGGETLTFYGAILPTALSADGDVPTFPEPYSKVIEYGALAEAADFKSDPQENEYRQLYQLWIQKLRRHRNRRRGQMVQQFRVIGEDMRPPHDPSTDVRGLR